MSKPPPRKLLLTFDAFGTLFHPRYPVFKQYGDVARRLGMTTVPNDETIESSFRQAFKKETKVHPNYGKEAGMRAPEWWANIISAVFTPHLAPGHSLPDKLVPELINRFASAEGYSLYPDVAPLFQAIRASKNGTPTAQWPWRTTVVGVITNSDDRVPGILSSLGLSVGSRAVGSFQQEAKIARVDEDISFVVLSYDVGAEKPAKAMWDAAKELLRATLTSTDQDQGSLDQDVEDFCFLHVGDEVVKDCFGAEEAGWRSILVDRKNEYTAHFEQGKSIVDVPVGGRQP